MGIDHPKWRITKEAGIIKEDKRDCRHIPNTFTTYHQIHSQHNRTAGPINPQQLNPDSPYPGLCNIVFENGIALEN